MAEATGCKNSNANKNVKTFLEEIELAHLYTLFEKEEITTLELLFHCTDADPFTLGVSKLGNRMKIRHAISMHNRVYCNSKHDKSNPYSNNWIMLLCTIM